VIAARSARLAAVALVLAGSLVAGCGEAKKPKVDAATERAEALERAKQGPYGTQLKSLETAKSLSDDINKKASESVDKIEKDAK
jgi:outer membrane murein-binding lipoprotein Lpp